MKLKTAFVRYLNQHLLCRWDLVLRKAGHDSENATITPVYRARLVDEICRILAPFVIEKTQLLAPGQEDDLRLLVEEFLTVYANRPVRDNTGGSGFNGSLLIYLLTRLSAPRLIVESGTWQGHTAWLLSRACPDAEVHTFDVTHEQLVHRQPGIAYHLGDWMDAELPQVDPAHSLVFFDDHISHAARIRQAHRRGFRTLILDDNLPAHALFATGDPPAPTAAMLTDDRLQPGETVEWLRHGRRKRFVCTPDDWQSKRLIEEYHLTPNLSSVSYYKPHIGTCLVRLRG